MSNHNSQIGEDVASGVANSRVWPRKLNILLIGIGLVAFGLIIVDRLVNMMSVDDLAENVGIDQPASDQDIVATQSADVIEPVADPLAAVNENSSSIASESSEDVVSINVNDAQGEAADGADPVPDMEAVFGGQLVFVSASEPLYVVTEDERRIDVGGNIDAQTTLSGLTNEQIIIDKAGDLIAIDLPVP